MVHKGKNFYGYSRIHTVAVSAVGLGSSTEVALLAAPFPILVKKCSVIVNTTITGQNTNYQTLGFKSKGPSGTATNVIASKAFTSGVNATQFDETDLGEVSNKWNKIMEGDVITFYKAETLSGHAMPSLVAQIRYTRL